MTATPWDIRAPEENPPPAFREKVRSRRGEAHAWAVGYLMLLVLTQLALISPIGGLRIMFRIITFSSGLLMLGLVRTRGGAHPASRLGIITIIIVFLEILHPSANVLPAAVAQALLYLAVMAPLFWVPRTWLSERTLRVMLLILWIFHGAGAMLGVLQVYVPGMWQAPLSSTIAGLGRSYVETLKITNAFGQRVFRPMGLTDVPGGAAGSGFYAVLLGMGYLLTGRTRRVMLIALASIVVGMMAIYLSQVRALLVITVVSMVAMSATLVMRRDFKRLSWFSIVLVIALVGGFRGAQSMARGNVTQRVSSLTNANPGQVYYQNRGFFLEEAFTRDLPEFPLGAGLGRWGMMNAYFGDPTSGVQPLWAEIQWVAWILDGGLPLMLAYLATVCYTLLITWRIARFRWADASLSYWATMVFANGVGTLALTFSYPVFLSQPGMEFWLLQAVVFAVGRTKAYEEAERWGAVA
ncbi:MAG: hypothetical protein JWO05_1747 [Gemmatimonadetes bacterium]|nr:hypothetical protein [Gemmatimonadota bacterium]